jgi:hypothetical protein
VKGRHDIGKVDFVEGETVIVAIPMQAKNRCLSGFGRSGNRPADRPPHEGAGEAAAGNRRATGED